ncbi:HlyC/CorC family transporter [Meridianimarinicoccus aquatilis]|uniref:HlyC/CorC family transporter n=1 Tax=Meridianimarinicoccus aquatilis TaxID=2552766 RepID=A0A4R6B4C4_9RHOB|nr:HlyC/CorC family transporter [Fluviibacterium aquatile]QIE42312.1 HlyC/CorC family transporter [Rhodobacteraceae bacterium SC52]TDL91285.1 HlyC/CorC family transporter [Fluviibacterium aquatile]
METGEVFDTAFWMTASAIFLLLICSAMFSGSETALTAASRGKLRSMSDDGSRGAGIALKLTEDSERLIGSILLGNNIANILATSLATALFTRTLGESGVAAATLVMTVLVLVFAEVLPKTYAISNSEKAAALAAPVIRIIVRTMAPPVAVVRLIVRGVLGLFGVKVDPTRNVLSIREEIVGTLTLGHSEGVFEKEDRDRLLGALDLGDRTVEEIMRHRSSIEMIDADTPAPDVVAQALQSPHTRLPVYKDDPENIIGVIHAKDLLRAVHDRIDTGGDAGLLDFDIMSVARKPYFVPETSTLDDQMRQFLKRHTHFALVVDEYGDLQGLITLEDILEEIVGEITDEFDSSADQMIVKSSDGKFLVDGAMTIRDLNRARDWSLPDEAANTIAGFVIHEAQMIPRVGQVFIFRGFRFEVTARENNRITRLKISPVGATPRN